jgi:hypothetical protein
MPTYFTGIGATIESTPGDEETVVVADHFDVVSPGPQFTKNGSGIILRNMVRPWMHGVQSKVVHGAYWDISFTTEVKTAPGTVDEPEISALLQAAGFEGTEVLNTSWTYDPFDNPISGSSIKTVTLQAEETTDGVEYIAFGCRFTVEFTFSVGEPLLANWTGVGAYKRPADLAALTSWTLDAGTPVAYLGNSNPCQIHSYNMILRGGTIRLNYEPTVRASMGEGSTDQYYKWPAILVRNTPAEFSFDIEAEDQASFAAWQLHEEVTAADGVLEFGASDEIVFNLKNMQFNAPAPQPGVPNMYQLTGIMTGSSGTGPFNIVYT